MNIYVGNLSYDVGDAELRQAFSSFGTVVSAKVISDMETGRSRGFGFVEMESSADGETAIASLNGTELMGRTITVNEARPKSSSGAGGRGGQGGGGGFRQGGQGGGGRFGGGRGSNSNW